MIHPGQSICDLGLRSLEQSGLRHSLERTDFEQLKKNVNYEHFSTVWLPLHSLQYAKGSAAFGIASRIFNSSWTMARLVHIN